MVKFYEGLQFDTSVHVEGCAGFIMRNLLLELGATEEDLNMMESGIVHEETPGKGSFELKKS